MDPESECQMTIRNLLTMLDEGSFARFPSKVFYVREMELTKLCNDARLDAVRDSMKRRVGEEAHERLMSFSDTRHDAKLIENEIYLYRDEHVTALRKRLDWFNTFNYWVMTPSLNQRFYVGVGVGGMIAALLRR